MWNSAPQSLKYFPSIAEMPCGCTVDSGPSRGMRAEFDVCATIRTHPCNFCVPHDGWNYRRNAQTCDCISSYFKVRSDLQASCSNRHSRLNKWGA